MKTVAHLGAGLGDGTEDVDHVGLGHADTGVADEECFVLLVGRDADVELLLSLERRRVSQRLVADLVERIRAVGDDLAKEDLLVRVERVCAISVRATDKERVYTD